MKRIEIIISPQGESRVETHGFTGRDCITASRFLTEALGVVVAESLTPAFYQGTMVQKNDLPVNQNPSPPQ